MWGGDTHVAVAVKGLDFRRSRNLHGLQSMTFVVSFPAGNLKVRERSKIPAVPRVP
mgnify:CR=1